MHEIVKWAGAIASLIGFALAMGVNPALYGATADMLARGGSVVKRLSWMIAGLVVGATILYIVLQTFNPTSYISALRGHLDHAIVNQWVDLVAGILFLLSAAWVAWWRLSQPALVKKPPKQPAQDTAAVGYFGIGIGSAVIGFTTWPLMYLVGRLITALSHEWALRAVAYAVFLVALVSPFILLAWVWSRFPKAAQKITDFYTRALDSDYRWVLAALLAIAGLVFLGLSFFLPR